MTKIHVIEITKKLITYTEELETVFNDVNIKPENTPAFFQFVKEETNSIFSLLDRWIAILENALEKGTPIVQKNIILSTEDNMKALIMHSYYKDVRRRRYMEIQRSCIYIYQLILKELDNE